MKQKNSIINNLKSKTLGLAMAAVLIPGGVAMAHDGAVVRKDLSGHVEVVHQVPGGTVVVGADWGKRREPAPVVVVQAPPRREVVIIEKEHGHGHGRGRGHDHEYGRGYDRGYDRNYDRGYDRHEQRQVTIIKEVPRKQITIIKTVEQRPHREVVVVEKRVETVAYNHASIQDDRDGQLRNVYVRK
jgi:hypothetical protein